MKPTNLLRHLLLFAAIASFPACGDSDGDRYEHLDRLRVLAIRSDPPDLSFGETATLSANVYEPAGRELSYSWSWCPSRADSDADFECSISEQELERAWAAAGVDGSPPAYTLGTVPEAELTHVFAQPIAAALCQAQTGDDDLDERIAFMCFKGLQASIKLTVRSSVAEISAIKSLPLIIGETPDLERNKNPIADFDVTLRDDTVGTVVERDQPLRAGHRYVITADVDEANAESFTPSGAEGEPSPEARRETMVMSWFITEGRLTAPDGSDALISENEHTTFVDGRNDFNHLLENGWKLPLTAGSSAELRLVLRDERGGVGWTTRSFAVIGGAK